ncbi:MAG TPA: PilZ domain-containing protein [Blastocatellia bacterium]|nr:PilZ domain-containing protein [Blastocatellia bacterium]
MHDQRRSERIPILIDVEFESAGVRRKARITNLGTLGVFIETDSPLTVGLRLKLSFSLEQGQLIEAYGVVAHRQTGSGVGVAFISISSDQVNQIKKLIEGQQP